MTVTSVRILLSGKLAVKCDEIFLHFVNPFEFVDSVEWRRRRPRTSDESSAVTPSLGGMISMNKERYQVTYDAVSDCTMLRLPAASLARVTEEDEALGFTLDCLIGRDVTRKLYSMSESVGRAASGGQGGVGAANERGQTMKKTGEFKWHEGPRTSSLIGGSDFQRTNSCDAVHTGCKGLVRSQDWIKHSADQHAQDGGHLTHILEKLIAFLRGQFGGVELRVGRSPCDDLLATRRPRARRGQGHNGRGSIHCPAAEILASGSSMIELRKSP